MEESIQFKEDDISDPKKEPKESKFEINDLRKQLLYLETYSRGENVKFFGIDEEVPASEVDSPPKDTRDLVFKFLENKLRIENRRARIEFQYCKENIYTEKGECSFEELRAARMSPSIGKA